MPLWNFWTSPCNYLFELPPRERETQTERDFWGVHHCRAWRRPRKWVPCKMEGRHLLKDEPLCIRDILGTLVAGAAASLSAAPLWLPRTANSQLLRYFKLNLHPRNLRIKDRLKSTTRNTKLPKLVTLSDSSSAQVQYSRLVSSTESKDEG